MSSNPPGLGLGHVLLSSYVLLSSRVELGLSVLQSSIAGARPMSSKVGLELNPNLVYHETT